MSFCCIEMAFCVEWKKECAVELIDWIISITEDGKNFFFCCIIPWNLEKLTWQDLHCFLLTCQILQGECREILSDRDTCNTPVIRMHLPPNSFPAFHYLVIHEFQNN